MFNCLKINGGSKAIPGKVAHATSSIIGVKLVSINDVDFAVSLMFYHTTKKVSSCIWFIDFVDLSGLDDEVHVGLR